MKKLNKTLEDAIRQNPEKLYGVIIVIKDGSDLNELKLEQAKKLMDNILSAELKGSKILSIAEHNSVESIELDSEVSIT